MQIIVISYLVCAGAFLLMTALVLVSATRTRYKWLLGAASGISALWAATTAAAGWLPATTSAASGAAALVVPLEVLRNAAWIAFLGELLGLSRKDDLSRRARWALGAAVAGPAIAVLTVRLIDLSPGLGGSAALLAGFAYLLFPITGLVLLENIFRNADADGRWGVKFLCFGLGGLFAYDFYLYADALLFKRVDTALYDARGLANALTVPLIAVAVSRAHNWSVAIHVSRQFVFHSATFLGAGLYLLVMAAAGLYLRNVGGTWGPAFQIIFFSGAVLILTVIFSSGAIRSKIKVFISKNFFSYKYDYRQEWLRFIQTISSDETGVRLHNRILRAVANIVDSPAGALWVLRTEDSAYFPIAVWNLGDRLASVRDSDPMVTFLAERTWIVNLPEIADRPEAYGGLTTPDWLAAIPRAWLVVPLVHGEVLRAFLLLTTPRASRSLNWEDYDLLKTVGRQAASYLAEENAANALVDARQLEAFNRRFAFIAHDIKNLASQLSLMLKNAERYGDDPKFRQDMFATVTNSVTRMKGLLEQLHAERDRSGPLDTATDTGANTGAAGGMDAPTSLASLLQRTAADWRKQKSDLGLDLETDGADILVDGERLMSVLNHLLQNAIEAAGPAGRVRLSLHGAGDERIIEVEDDGPGMSAEFIENELFRPLNTTKQDGYGIGAYQTRELVREMGGRLEVKSAPGEGTRMQVILPARATPQNDRNATEGAARP